MSYFVCSPAVGHMGCFHVLAVANDAAMSMGVQMPLAEPAFGSYGCAPSSGIAGSNGNASFNIFLREE